ncbi:uncharacterized protein [Arachis hypogaea]|uniref:uncharacterized protein isoform X2 n=1 Tax=Arachis hypogaea TaxID=3818 RepID=UPI000DEC5E5F|nr:uncharacterized protein LOC112696273 isoform X3 [Arachis hypogaea]XP_025604731.1 uncharacterized protein LOC112696273 isoform X3 [Arachis hypogaea]
MNTCFHSLDKITPWRGDWRIRVRINRVWSAPYGVPTRDGNLIHMVLMDDKLTKIEGTITESLIPYFNEVLEKRNVYVIAHFTVVPNSGLTRLTQHRFRIIFHSKTIVVPTMSIGMPNAAFKFTSIDEVVEKRCNEDFLIDFVGFIVGVRQETDIGSHGERMKVIILEVVSDGKKKIQCNVIGRSCEVFDLSILKKYQRPPVVVLEAFKIKVLGDYVCLQNVINISTVLINPDMYESVEFLSRFNVACYEFSRFIPIVSGYLVAGVGDGFVDWRAVRSIEQLKKHSQDGIFYVVGTVTEVVDDPNWWYHSCVCGNAVVANDNSYHCDICDSCVEHVVLKYRITVIVDDGTSSAAFALVDNAATKLFGKTCAEAFLHIEKELHSDCNDVSMIDQSSSVPLLHGIIGNKIVFKVQMRSVLGQHYSDQFKVVNLFGDIAESSLPVHCLNEFIHCPIFNPIYPTYSAPSCIQNLRCQISSSGLIETEPIGRCLGRLSHYAFLNEFLKLNH